MYLESYFFVVFLLRVFWVFFTLILYLLYGCAPSLFFLFLCIFLHGIRVMLLRKSQFFGSIFDLLLSSDLSVCCLGSSLACTILADELFSSSSMPTFISCCCRRPATLQFPPPSPGVSISATYTRCLFSFYRCCPVSQHTLVFIVVARSPSIIAPS